jgi:hypothetical protein
LFELIVVRHLQLFKGFEFPARIIISFFEELDGGLRLNRIRRSGVDTSARLSALDRIGILRAS